MENVLKYYGYTARLVELPEDEEQRVFWVGDLKLEKALKKKNCSRRIREKFGDIKCFVPDNMLAYGSARMVVRWLILRFLKENFVPMEEVEQQSEIPEKD
jgi:hypothetical protein